jgi:hypothetical protein
MIMRTKFLKLSYSLFALAVLAGCKKALDISPKQSISSESALSTRDNFNAALTSIYATLKSPRLYGRDLIAIPEVLADNGFATNKSGRLLNEANNVSGAHFTTSVYQLGYQSINQINLLLAKIGDVKDAVSTDRSIWEGQLYFLRGLYYFDLVRVYAYMPGAVVTAQNRGGVPLFTTYTDNVDSARAQLPTRAPIDSVYAQIVRDLVAANSRYITSSFTSTSDVSVANKAAIQGLLSRVHLYAKNYTECKRWSDSCITLAGSRLTTTASYVNNWRGPTHNETLFQVRFASTAENIGVNESLQTTFTTLVSLGSTVVGGFGDVVPTLTLLTDLGIVLSGGMTTANFALTPVIASRTADVRNQLYDIGAARGTRKIETTKYLGKNGAINLDNVPVIRIAEIYLNRAEAMATTGSAVYNEVAALADLNTIITNRGLTAVTLTNTVPTTNALYEEILRQRRIEFAFEGHRFFDLKRLGRDLVKAPHYNNVAFTDYRILPAFPQREIDINPTGMSQNFGY